MNEDFAGFLRQRAHLSLSTQECNANWLRDFEHFLREQKLRWQDTTTAAFQRYHQQLLWRAHARGGLYSPNTVDQALRTLRTFFHWAFAQGLVTRDPGANLILPRPPQPEQPILDRAQVLALFNLPNLSKPTGIRDALILELLYAFPLNTQACGALRLDQVVGARLKLEGRSYPLDGTLSAMRHYLDAARPKLAKCDVPALLLTKDGHPCTCVAHLVRFYGLLLGLPQLSTPAPFDVLTAPIRVLPLFMGKIRSS